jgi:hypothetical protein
MCPADGITEFGRRTIAALTRDNLAEPVLLIVDRRQSRGNSWQAKLGRGLRFNGNLWRLQSKLLPTAQLPLYRRHPLEQVLTGVPRLVCHPERRGEWSEHFSDADIAAIRGHKLDFILKHGFNIIRGGILNAAEHGVWSFHHGDEECYRGGPPGFWEIYRNDPVTGVILQRLNERLDGGIVLKKCFAPTNTLSYRENLSRILESSTHMVRWACLDLVQGRLRTADAAPSPTQAPILRAPTDVQTLRFWAKLATHRLHRRITAQRVDEWNAGMIEAPQAAFLDPAFEPRIEWTTYREPRQMIADPFLMPGPEGPRLMVEEYSWSLAKGRISELRRAGPGKPFDSIATVLEEPWHLSYPHIFEHAGVYYAIPEAAGSNRISLYRIDPDTGGWEFDRVLIDNIDAADATIFQHEGRWWMLHSGTQASRAWSLFAWHAPALTGPWEPHTANPVKSDITSARPGGNVFRHAGQLYRPAQDGRLAYGGALAIMRIDELSVEAFRETVVRRITPGAHWPYPDGCHTLSGYAGYTVIDAKKHTWPLGFLVQRFLDRRLGKAGRPFSYTSVKNTRP